MTKFLITLFLFASFPLLATMPEERVVALESTFDNRNPGLVVTGGEMSVPVASRPTKRKFQWTPEIKQKYLEHQASLHTQKASVMGYGALGAAGVSALGALEIHLGLGYPSVFSYMGYGIGGFALGFAGLGILLAATSKSLEKSDAVLIGSLTALGVASVIFSKVAGAIFFGAMGFVGALLAVTLSALAIDQALKAREKNKELENLKSQ